MCIQGGGAPLFQKKADALEKEIVSAEQEAGGNQEELELSYKRVSVSNTCVAAAGNQGGSFLCMLSVLATACVRS